MGENCEWCEISNKGKFQNLTIQGSELQNEKY